MSRTNVDVDDAAKWLQADRLPDRRSAVRAGVGVLHADADFAVLARHTALVVEQFR